jgi:hypothetical protein
MRRSSGYSSRFWVGRHRQWGAVVYDERLQAKEWSERLVYLYCIRSGEGVFCDKTKVRQNLVRATPDELDAAESHYEAILMADQGPGDDDHAEQEEEPDFPPDEHDFSGELVSKAGNPVS